MINIHKLILRNHPLLYLFVVIIYNYPSEYSHGPFVNGNDAENGIMATWNSLFVGHRQCDARQNHPTKKL